MGDLSNVKESLQNANSKRAYNRQLFEIVAPRYQTVTRVLSFNNDRLWKKRLIDAIPPDTRGTAVDLACGTGDLTLALCNRMPHSRVAGVDLTPTMLEFAARRVKTERCFFIRGDMQRIPLADKSVAVVTGGYALRNAPNLNETLAETARILHPDGIAAFLDFTRDSSMLHRARLAALKAWGNVWGMVFHGNPAVYGYIADSLQAYPMRTELHRLCENAGIPVVMSKLYFFGFAELIVCRKIKK